MQYEGLFSRISRWYSRVVTLFSRENAFHFFSLAPFPLTCESIRFFRLKFLVSPAKNWGETRNLGRKNRMLSQATFPLAPELLGQAFVLFYVRSRLRRLFTSTLIGFELIGGVGALPPGTVPHP